MSEHIDFSIFLENKSALPSRSDFVELLFDISPRWLRRPDAVLVQNLELQSADYLKWRDAFPHIDRWLAEGAFLTIYAKSNGTPGDRRSVSIDEASSNVVYGISIALTSLIQDPVDKIEDWIIDIYKMASRFTKICIVGGSEIKLHAQAFTIREAVEYAMDPMLNAFWVMADEQDISQPAPNLTLARKIDSAVLLRRPIPLASLQFSIPVDELKE